MTMDDAAPEGRLRAVGGPSEGGASRVAVDCMGGDDAPAAIVAGCQIAHERSGIPMLLVGRSDELTSALEAAGGSPSDAVEVVDAPDAIEMQDPDPARAVRSKRDASIAVACRLVRDGRADAVVSAGPTGATLAAAVLNMRRIRGVSRPAIAVVLPFADAPTVLIDAGANVDVRPEQLAHFAVLGSVFAEIQLGIPEPRVGLLSVGEEEGKGNELTKAASGLIASTGVRSVGNVEGRDIPSDAVDVVVTDGFTGNVVLKLLEGFGTFLMGELLKVFDANEETRKASEVLLPGLLDLRSSLSPDTHGGAHLLGVSGVCIIGHGSSNAEAVASAVDVASRAADAGLVERLTQRLRSRTPEGTR